MKFLKIQKMHAPYFLLIKLQIIVIYKYSNMAKNATKWPNAEKNWPNVNKNGQI